MLTAEDNELLCRVGPGTPMGEMFRRYWIPALLSEEIPEPGGPPVRVRLLGEDLVAFRDTQGRIGLIGANCSHRRAPLFFARPEEGGLRCIYHGWKYDVDGKVLDTPCELPTSTLKETVRHPAYPCREINGLIYTYMGPKEKMPLVPNYEWMTNLDRQPAQSKYWMESNWLQGVEGDCDSSHQGWLHRRAGAFNTVGNTLEPKPGHVEALTFEIETGPWFVKGAATRYIGEGIKYVRTNVFIPPCIGIPPGGPDENGIASGWFHVVYQVPVDDYNSLRFDIHGGMGGEHGDGLENKNELDSNYRKLRNRDNDYLIDREAQQTRVFSGIDSGNHTQDAVVTEGMGAISDRTKENLGACDAQPIAMRQFLLKAVRSVMEGQDPPGVAFDPADNVFDDLWMVNAILPIDTPVQDRAQVVAHAMLSPAQQHEADQAKRATSGRQ